MCSSRTICRWWNTRRRGDGDVPRPLRGKGSKEAIQQSAPSLHSGAAVGDAAVEPGYAPRAYQVDRRTAQPNEPAAGLRVQRRCRRAFGTCVQPQPQLKQYGGEQMVACFAVDQTNIRGVRRRMFLLNQTPVLRRRFYYSINGLSVNDRDNPFLNSYLNVILTNRYFFKNLRMRIHRIIEFNGLLLIIHSLGRAVFTIFIIKTQ